MVIEVKKSILGCFFDYILFIIIVLGVYNVIGPMIIGTISSIIAGENIFFDIIGFVFICFVVAPFVAFLILYSTIPTGLILEDNTLTIKRWFKKEIVDISDISICEGKVNKWGLNYIQLKNLFVFRVKGKQVTLERYRYTDTRQFEKELLKRVESRFDNPSLF